MVDNTIKERYNVYINNNEREKMTTLNLNKLLRKYSAGFEIEWTGMEIQDAETQLLPLLANEGLHIEREGYNHRTRPHWKVVTDNTVTEHRNYSQGTGYGGEFVSPVHNGTDTIDKIQRFLKAVNTIQDGNGNKIDVNSNCSVHIHISWADMQPDHIKNLFKRYAQFETVIDSWMAPSRRGNRNTWCKSLSNLNLSRMDRETTLRGISYLYGRYHKVNFSNNYRQYGTVEFRHHGGTTDFQKISEWFKFLLCFIEQSIHSDTNIQRFTRTRRVAYGEVRELVARQGHELRFANNCYKLFDEDGNLVQKLSFETMESFYNQALLPRVRELTQDFTNWYGNRFGIDSTPDTVFKGVLADTQTFLETRIQHFNNNNN